ncbi:zinc-ribbon domain-containing protein, partial [Cribrihabitans sp. XS_ASV171]
MRLTCPNCGAQYEVPPEVIPAEGRDVQCSNCGDTWYQPHPETAQAGSTPEPDTPQAPAEAQERPDPVDEELPETEADAPLPPETAAPAREMDPAISDILREEAERESRLRRSEAETLESQPDLGLDTPGTEEPARRAREARSRMA